MLCHILGLLTTDVGDDDGDSDDDGHDDDEDDDDDDNDDESNDEEEVAPYQARQSAPGLSSSILVTPAHPA